MFLAVRKHMEKREEGFTLIELLVVVIIIGILAAIAIPAFLNQRQRAWRASLQSDLRNAAIEAETYFTDTQSYASYTVPTTMRKDPKTSFSIKSATATEFCIEGAYTGLSETWKYDSDGNPQLVKAVC